MRHSMRYVTRGHWKWHHSIDRIRVTTQYTHYTVPTLLPEPNYCTNKKICSARHSRCTTRNYNILDSSKSDHFVGQRDPQKYRPTAWRSAKQYSLIQSWIASKRLQIRSQLPRNADRKPYTQAFEWYHFQWPKATYRPNFRVTTIFDAEYVSSGTR